MIDHCENVDHQFIFNDKCGDIGRYCNKNYASVEKNLTYHRYSIHARIEIIQRGSTRGLKFKSQVQEIVSKWFYT